MPGSLSVQRARGEGRSHKVVLVATEVGGGYHTSIHVDGKEYYFDDAAGVVSGGAMHSHTGGRAPGLKTHVINAGFSEFDGDMLVSTLSPIFSQGSYDHLRKNSNSFTDAALFLLTGKRLPGYLTRGERILLATEPISTWILPHLMAVMSLVMDEDASAAGAFSMYKGNPSAIIDFSVDRVISSHLCELRQDPVDAQRERSARKRRSRALCP